MKFRFRLGLDSCQFNLSQTIQPRVYIVIGGRPNSGIPQMVFLAFHCRIKSFPFILTVAFDTPFKGPPVRQSGGTRNVTNRISIQKFDTLLCIVLLPFGSDFDGPMKE